MSREEVETTRRVEKKKTREQRKSNASKKVFWMWRI